MEIKSIRILRLIRALQSRIIKLDQQQEAVDYWRKQGVEIAESVMVNLGEKAYLEIGPGSNIGAYTILDLTDDPNCKNADGNNSESSSLVIGRNTAINEFNNIRAAGGKIEIGSNCLISQFVSIIATNHSFDHPGLIREAPWEMRKNSVEIGDDVWVGTHVVILPGVKIGTGSVLAAGSVVTRSIPEYALVGGIPAEVIRYRQSKFTSPFPANTID